MAKSTRHKFRAQLESDAEHGHASWITIPFDVPDVFGTRSRVPVCGTINGFPFRGSLAPMGGCHLLGINKELRTAANAKAGDTVEIVLERDTAPRVIEAPPDLAKALKANQAAQAAWEKLSYTHRKEHVKAIEEAKKPETRRRRIAKALEMLSSMKMKQAPRKK